MFLHQSEIPVAVLAGIIAHWTYFIHGEHDLEAPNIARVHILLAILIAYLEWSLAQLPIWHAIYQSLAIDSAYLAGLMFSIIVFRLFLSPLRNIPGPLRLRWTKLVHVWDTSRGQNFKDLHQLQHEYGDVVRTGPNEVTVFGTDAYFQVHGSDTTCTKAAYYDILKPMVSVQTTRDPVVHAHRHKVWDQAMSIKSLERLEPAVYELANKLIDELRYRENEIINMTQWVEYYTFDLMGLVSMGVSFRGLSKCEDSIISLFRRAHRNLGLFAPAPWMQHLFMSIPFITRMKDLRQYNEWANDQLAKNIEDLNHNSSRTDMMKHVIEDAMKHGGVQQNFNDVFGDFIIAVVAGSDPPWQALVDLVYYLTREPKHIGLIHQELGLIDLHDYRALQMQSHLNACIYETLRLHPGVPSGSYRLPPRGGITLNGVYIADGTTIVTPQYSLQRDKRNFVQPDDWIPERFTTRPELILDKRAFMPWGIGKHVCLGKNFSLMEMRVAVALLVTEFDFSFAPGEDKESVLTQTTDFFTAAPGPLKLVLGSRKSKN